MTGVAGGDIPTIELTAADVGDIADDADIGVALVVAAAVDVRAFTLLSADEESGFAKPTEECFEPMSVRVTERRILLLPMPSPSDGPVFTECSASSNECFREEGKNCNGGGWALVAGTTHLSASFTGDDAAEDEAVDFVGDGVPTRPVSDAGPPLPDGV